MGELPDGQIWADVALVALKAGFFTCAPTWQLPPRVLPHYQLWLVTGGEGTLAQGSQEQHVSAGDIVIIPPSVPHWAGHTPDRPLRCYVLHFLVRVLGATAPNVLATMPARMRPANQAYQQLVEAADHTCTELTSDQPASILLANAAITRAVGLLWRTSTTRGAPDREAATNAGPSARLAPVFSYIVAHHAQNLTLAELSSVMHMSPAHLSHIFRAAVGLSPFQYLLRYRLWRAKDLLDTTDLTVTQIAGRTGFADPSYFSRAFRRLEGLSPTQYRNIKRNTNSP